MGDVEGQKQRQLSEIKHGRLAMIAITAFAAQEFVDHTAVVDHAAIFFKPITQVLGDMDGSALPGLYVAPPTDVPDGDAAIEAVNAAVEAASSLDAAGQAAASAVGDTDLAATDAATAALEAVTTPPPAAVVEATTLA